MILETQNTLGNFRITLVKLLIGIWKMIFLKDANIRLDMNYGSRIEKKLKAE